MRTVATPSPSSAVVFAYHNVGVRCLSVLLAQGVEIKCVVTHPDNPNENIWFASVAQLAHEHGIPVVMPEDANAPEFVSYLRSLKADFLFSFYYRSMLSNEVLNAVSRGAYNMHGSLLPKYRGRVPVNWAVLHGESEGGATLHRMVEKPDAGEIVAQQAIPILPNDTAFEVFQKTTVAAEMALHGVLPALLAGTAPHLPMPLSQGSYFGGRKPADGEIHWEQSATQIHNLVRAVAPPYPGAFCVIDGKTLIVERTRLHPEVPDAPIHAKIAPLGQRLFVRCGDQQWLEILRASIDGENLSAAEMPNRLNTLLSKHSFFQFASEIR